MKMTKALTITWAPVDDPIAKKLGIAGRLLKSTEMFLENKISHHTVITNNNIVKRFFVDQAAVEEYLNFCKILESRYQTKIDKIEITDI
jgi:hypothetical protein